MPERRLGLSALEPGFGLYLGPPLAPLPGPLCGPLRNPYFAPLAGPALVWPFTSLFGPCFDQYFGFSSFLPCVILPCLGPRFESPFGPAFTAPAALRVKLNFRIGSMVFGRAFAQGI